MSLRRILLASMLLIGNAAMAATPGPAAEAEIAHLLSYLETSGCEFYRNGSWHDAKNARAHLQKKRDHLLKRSLIGSAEDFIDRAATSSSVTGQEYRVRCTPGHAVSSGAWLREELGRFRARQAKPETRTDAAFAR
jgi:hypothetical protein